jgi:hypothetical protein
MVQMQDAEFFATLASELTWDEYQVMRDLAQELPARTGETKVDDLPIVQIGSGLTPNS